MKSIIKYFLYSVGVFWLLIITFSSTLYAQKSQEKRVRNTFEQYKNAILNNKGEVAAQYVDSRTINYYAETLELVKNADSLSVASLSMLDKLMVFSVRHRTPREKILSFDGRQLFIYAIQEGMVGKESVQRNALGEISIKGDFAQAQLVSSGRATPFFFHFYRENKKWGLDLTSLFPLSEAAFQQLAKESEMEENEFIFYLLSIVSGSKVESNIWQPIR